MIRALAPANPSFAEFAYRSDFFSKLLSRADKANKTSRALAPARCLFTKLAATKTFFRRPAI
jgi:hypothetical protein